MAPRSETRHALRLASHGALLQLAALEGIQLTEQQAASKSQTVEAILDHFYREKEKKGRLANV